MKKIEVEYSGGPLNGTIEERDNLLGGGYRHTMSGGMYVLKREDEEIQARYKLTWEEHIELNGSM